MFEIIEIPGLGSGMKSFVFGIRDRDKGLQFFSRDSDSGLGIQIFNFVIKYWDS